MSTTHDILEAQGKENLDIVNRMREYKDPLLTAFDEELEEMDRKAERKKMRELGTSTKADGDSDDNIDSSSEGDSDDESSSEDEEESVDIKFPNTNIEDLL